MKRRKRTQKLKRYARDFCRQVKTDFPKYITTEKQPLLRCYVKKAFTTSEIVNDQFMEKTENGHTIIDGFARNDGIIELYDIVNAETEALKRTLRHECLHFLLRESGLPYDDDNEIFLVFAIAYNANPYGMLGEDGEPKPEYGFLTDGMKGGTKH